MPNPMPKPIRRRLAALALLTLPVLAGCGLVKPVQAWEKGALARPAMAFDGGDALEAGFAEHTYTSKEAASGGATLGGGGCGCN